MKKSILISLFMLITSLFLVSNVFATTYWRIDSSWDVSQCHFLEDITGNKRVYYASGSCVDKECYYPCWYDWFVYIDRNCGSTGCFLRDFKTCKCNVPAGYKNYPEGNEVPRANTCSYSDAYDSGMLNYFKHGIKCSGSKTCRIDEPHEGLCYLGYGAGWRPCTIGSVSKHTETECYEIEDSQKPWFKNNQKDIVINSSTDVSQIKIDFDAFDNLHLTYITIEAYNNRRNIVSESKNIGYDGIEPGHEVVTSYIDDWALSSGAWNKIKKQEMQNLSVNIKIKDYRGNTNSSINSFNINVSDLSVPDKVDVVRDPLLNYSGMPITFKINASDKFSNIKKINLYIDGELEGSCSSDYCEILKIFSTSSAGNHSYYATAEDLFGNINQSIIYNLTLINEEEKKCEELPDGKKCNADEECEYGFFKTSDTEYCCLSECINKEQFAKCSEQGGTIYPSDYYNCSIELQASDTKENNKCCAENPEIKNPGELIVYWTDGIGNKISGATIGELIKCKADGIGIGKVEMNVSKDKLFLNKTFENFPGYIELRAEEKGIYHCEASSEDQFIIKNLEIFKVPKIISKAKLPGFGILQLIIVLSLMIIYYYSKKRKFY